MRYRRITASKFKSACHTDPASLSVGVINYGYLLPQLLILTVVGSLKSAPWHIFYVQVNHSQKLSEKPLTPGIIAMDDGRILAAHCDCMAGLGETCFHVASLLWAIGIGVESRESLTVMQKSAYWVMHPAMKSIPYSPLKDIKFVGMRKNSEVSISVPAAKRSIPPPSNTEMSQFF